MAVYGVTDELVRTTLARHGYAVQSEPERSAWIITSQDEKQMLAGKVGDLVIAEYAKFNPYQNKEEKRQVQIKNVATITGAAIDSRAVALGVIVVFMSLCVIGVHGMLSGTSTMDFGGRRAAATAVGLIDGFVYLGTGIQSVALGFLTSLSWSNWPPFLVPFALIGLALSIKIWWAFPQANKSAH